MTAQAPRDCSIKSLHLRLGLELRFPQLRNLRRCPRNGFREFAARDVEQGLAQAVRGWSDRQPAYSAEPSSPRIPPITLMDYP